jgi:hypothetical protein
MKKSGDNGYESELFLQERRLFRTKRLSACSAIYHIFSIPEFLTLL